MLIVEDDLTTSKTIEVMLTHANPNVYYLDFGKEGVYLVRLYDYKFGFLDLNLLIWSVMKLFVKFIWKGLNHQHYFFFIIRFEKQNTLLPV